MPTVELPDGTVHYRVAGSGKAGASPVVFVHGILVSGTLWTATAEELAASGVRSYAPDWPLGSHPIPLNEGADRSPRGVARQVLAFLEALDLEDVTLVGSDTGGAICQFVLDTDATRIGRVVLTNCDAFEKFPPPPVDRLFWIMRRPGGVRALLETWRARAVRHSGVGFGLLTPSPTRRRPVSGSSPASRTPRSAGTPPRSSARSTRLN